MVKLQGDCTFSIQKRSSQLIHPLFHLAYQHLQILGFIYLILIVILFLRQIILPVLHVFFLLLLLILSHIPILLVIPPGINKTDLFWHQRLGHMPFHRMHSISSLSNKISTKQSFICPVCPMARQQRLPFPESSIHTTKPFQLIHLDTWGPYHTKTYNGFRYFITLVDDFTRATWTHIMSTKGAALNIIKAFTSMVEV